MKEKKNLEIKKDCFAYKPSENLGCGHCTALTGLYCKVEECSFYKTKEEYKQIFRNR